MHGYMIVSVCRFAFVVFSSAQDARESFDNNQSLVLKGTPAVVSYARGKDQGKREKKKTGGGAELTVVVFR